MPSRRGIHRLGHEPTRTGLRFEMDPEKIRILQHTEAALRHRSDWLSVDAWGGAVAHRALVRPLDVAQRTFLGFAAEAQRQFEESGEEEYEGQAQAWTEAATYLQGILAAIGATLHDATTNRRERP